MKRKVLIRDTVEELPVADARHPIAEGSIALVDGVFYHYKDAEWVVIPVTGATGAVGPQGPAGAAGATGAAGANGTNGADATAGVFARSAQFTLTACQALGAGVKVLDVPIGALPAGAILLGLELVGSDLPPQVTGFETVTLSVESATVGQMWTEDLPLPFYPRAFFAPQPGEFSSIALGFPFLPADAILRYTFGPAAADLNTCVAGNTFVVRVIYLLPAAE